MKLSEHCYIISGLGAETPWYVNSGFVTGKDSTLIIDAGTNYASAQTIYGYALCAEAGNKLMVVNTEPHFDHIGGNCLFREKNIDVFAHPDCKRTVDEFNSNKKDFNNTILNDVRREKNETEVFFSKTELKNPNKSLSDKDVIDLGGVEVEVHYTPGHTPCNISLFVPGDKVLYCGDSIVTGYIPNFEDGDVPDWKIWLQSIDNLEQLAPEIIVTSHGYHIVGSENIKEELSNTRRFIHKAIEDMKAPTQ